MPTPENAPQRALCDVHEKQITDLENVVFGEHGDGLKSGLVSVQTTLANLQESLREKFDSMQRSQRTLIGVLISVGVLFVSGFVTAVYTLLVRSG